MVREVEEADAREVVDIAAAVAARMKGASARAAELRSLVVAVAEAAVFDARLQSILMENNPDCGLAAACEEGKRCFSVVVGGCRQESHRLLSPFPAVSTGPKDSGNAVEHQLEAEEDD